VDGTPSSADLDAAWLNTSNRGYTDHEHLDNLTGLIHMNGRVYDSNIGRFISADPYVFEPYNTQGLNRYNYVANNPLSFTDPSGFQACSDPDNCGSDNPFDEWDWYGFGQRMANYWYAQAEAFMQARQAIWEQWIRDQGIDVPAAPAVDQGTPVGANAGVVAAANTRDFMQGGLAHYANQAIAYSPIGLVFCAELGCGGTEFFDVPDTEYGARGATTGEVAGYIAGGAGLIKVGGKVAAKAGAEIVAKNGTRIGGFTRHGVDRAIGDAASRAGTKPQAILDALKNPTKIVEGVDKQGRPFQVFTGQNARVVVNPETGQIVSVNPLSRVGAQP